MAGKLHSARGWLTVSVCTVALLGSDARGQSIVDRNDATFSKGAGPVGVQEPVNGELTQLLDKARSELQALKSKLAQAHKMGEQERLKREMMQRNFTLLRAEIDALKSSVDRSTDAREEFLRRELAQARDELTALRGNNEERSPQADADLLAKQAELFEAERQRAESLADELTAAEREIERLKSVAAQSAGATEAAGGALDQEGRRVRLFSREPAAARLAMQADAGAEKARAEAARQRAVEELTRERARANAAVQELAAARRETEAAKQELAQVKAARDALAAIEGELTKERDKSAALARDLAAARARIDALEAENKRRVSGSEDVSKPHAGTKAAKAKPKGGSKPIRKKTVKAVASAQNRKSAPARPTRIKLPASLLPTRLVGGGAP